MQAERTVDHRRDRHPRCPQRPPEGRGQVVAVQHDRVEATFAHLGQKRLGLVEGRFHGQAVAGEQSVDQGGSLHRAEHGDLHPAGQELLGQRDLSQHVTDTHPRAAVTPQPDPGPTAHDSTLGAAIGVDPPGRGSISVI